MRAVLISSTSSYFFFFYWANKSCQVITYNWANAAIKVWARASWSDSYCHRALLCLFLRRRRSGCDCDGSKAEKNKKKTAFIKTTPHHRKPCTNRTNAPPCFITAVSSHWCSHREICLDASAGSAVENSSPAKQCGSGLQGLFASQRSLSHHRFCTCLGSLSAMYFYLFGETTPTKDIHFQLTAVCLSVSLPVKDFDILFLFS